MDIRKTDSKGRLTLGTGYDGMFVRVESLGGGRWFLELVDEVETLPVPIPEPALEYMRSFGINPDQVLRQNANQWGYDEVQFDGEGHRVRAFGGHIVERKPWPEGFEWSRLMELGHPA